MSRLAPEYIGWLGASQNGPWLLATAAEEIEPLAHSVETGADGTKALVTVAQDQSLVPRVMGGGPPLGSAFWCSSDEPQANL